MTTSLDTSHAIDTENESQTKPLQHNNPNVLHDRREHHDWLSCDQLKEHWYVACTKRELERKKVWPAKILGLGIVVFHSNDNSIGALIDQCVHRGTALSAGKLNDGCITCPYHGWRYNKEGRVTHVPSIDGSSPPDKPHRFSQRSFPVKEAYGLVWVFLGDSSPENKSLFEMPFYKKSGWNNYYMCSRFKGSVSALAQNFMDVPHTVFVHNKIFRKSPDKLMKTSVEFTPHSVEVEYEDTEDSIGMMPWLTNPDKQPLVHTDQFHSPNITRCDYHWGDKSGFVITSQITPESANVSRVYTLISYKLPIPSIIARLLRPLIHLYTRIVLEQDISIIKVNRRGIENAPGLRTHSVQSDLVHIGIERLIDASKTGVAVDASKLGRKPMNFNL